MIAKADLNEEMSDTEDNPVSESESKVKNTFNWTYAPASPEYESEKKDTDEEGEVQECFNSPDSIYSQIRDDRSSPTYSPVHPPLDEEMDERGNPYTSLSSAEFENQMRLLRQFEREKRRRGYDTVKTASSAASSKTHHISVPVLNLSDLLSKDVNFFKAADTNTFC